jgi:hypothetical protein
VVAWDELDPFGSKANPFKGSFTELLNAIGEAAYRFTTMEEQLKQIIKLTEQKTHGGADDGSIWIRLLASAGNYPKWAYQWEEVFYVSAFTWDVVPDGRTNGTAGYTTAKNQVEITNTNTHGNYGIELDPPDKPYILTILPMTTIFQPIVRARLEPSDAGIINPWFEAINPTSIACKTVTPP